LKLATKLTILVLAAIVFLPALARAQCSVSTVGVNFGNYNPLSSSSVSSSGTITVLCSKRSTVSIAIGASPNSGSFQPRKIKLTSGADLLSYNLYTTSALTTIWGDGTSGTSTVSSTIAKGASTDFIVYGLAPGSQDVYIGSYNETLTATINF
jgi:spore coat protein U-like protein